MSIFNLKTNPTHRFLLHIWQSVSADFTQGIFWVPVVITVLGVPWTLFSFIICVIVAMICISALLVVRRRRALVLSSLKKGLLTFKNNNSDEGLVAAAAAAIPASSSSLASSTFSKNSKKTNYNHSMKKNQNSSVVVVAYPQGISNENDVRLCDLTQHGAEKLWPEGSARVFEGSELFYQGLTSQQLWDFCFGASKQQQKKQKSTSSFGLPLLMEESYDFVVENFASILESGGNITGCFLDFCHNWTATSLLCLLLLPRENGNNNNNNNITSNDISLFSRYFQTNTHFILGLFISVVMLLLGSSKIIDARKVRMWFVLVIFGGYFILGMSAKIDESVKFVVASASQIFSFFSSSSSSSSSTESKTIPLASRTEQMLYDSFFSKMSIDDTDDLENIHASLMMGKRSVAPNPASLLLHVPGVNVPFARQLAVFLLCAFTRFFVNNTAHPSSVTTPGADELDQFVDPTSFGEFLSSQQQQNQENVLERAKSISQGREVVTTASAAASKPSAAPTTPTVTTAVLTKDSVAVTSTFHFEYIVRKAAWSFIFATTAAWALPAMSWDAVFPTYVGAVAFKNPEIFGATFLQRVVVLTALLFVPFHFLTISLPKRLNSVFLNDPASIWTRYPRVGRGIFVTFAALLFIGALSSREIKGLRATAARRMTAKTDGDNAPEEIIPVIVVGTLETVYNFVAKNVFLGFEPWWIVARLDFFFSGTATITVPMLMFTKTEEALHDLGFPGQMVSLRAASLLDNGRARIIGLVWMALWSYFVFVRLDSM